MASGPSIAAVVRHACTDNAQIKEHFDRLTLGIPTKTLYELFDYTAVLANNVDYYTHPEGEEALIHIVGICAEDRKQLRRDQYGRTWDGRMRVLAVMNSPRLCTICEFMLTVWLLSNPRNANQSLGGVGWARSFLSTLQMGECVRGVSVWVSSDVLNL
jgi:hypothetical protein